MALLTEFLMNKQGILHIIKQGENEQVEFKQNFNQQAIQTLVAFANSNGGKVIIGVGDRGSIVGVNISAESIQNNVLRF